MQVMYKFVLVLPFSAMHCTITRPLIVKKMPEIVKKYSEDNFEITYVVPKFVPDYQYYYFS
jgi:hypothetical protein